MAAMASTCAFASSLLAPGDPRRVEAVLFQIAPRRDVGRIQANRGLEFGFHLAGQGEAAFAVRLFSVGAAQPLVIERIGRRKLHRSREVGDGLIEIALLVVGAGDPEMRFGIAGGDRRGGAERCDHARIVTAIELPLRFETGDEPP
jgi:hypothetical protein